MIASRAAGLQQLLSFVPRAGGDYARMRNSDLGASARANVSQLSVYLRYRLISEREVVESVLAQHSLQEAEKFVQEVLWRTYWKGWLEMRPQIWQSFLTERDQQRASFTDTGRIANAESGATGIEGLDDWARELAETGYLHNHARMWFASIWIHTLRLPWTLGADFFLRHLIDADAASNTLSWRWVAGLQTPGKTYLATTENIARFTGGRFAPKGLAAQALALTGPPLPATSLIPATEAYDASKPALLLVTPDDMSPDTFMPRSKAIKHIVVAAGETELWGKAARAFVLDAAADTAARLSIYYGCAVEVTPALDSTALVAAAQNARATQILTPYAPVGPGATALGDLAKSLSLAGISLAQQRRSWDSRFWPHATKGFFPFKSKMAEILAKEGLPV
jgi:deoxyribodipyrimidine photo-lyase